MAKLKVGPVPPDKCDGLGNTHLFFLSDDADEPRIPPCRKCGGEHAIVIKEVIVDRDANGELVAVPRSQYTSRPR